MSAKKLTEGQMARVWNRAFGMNPRVADYGAVKVMGDTENALADYIWDHMLGEPDNPTIGKVKRVIKESDRKSVV